MRVIIDIEDDDHLLRVIRALDVTHAELRVVERAPADTVRPPGTSPAADAAPEDTAGSDD